VAILISPLAHPKAAAGFTMVELVTTIVLVGILAATAMPRFFKKQTFDARGFSDQSQSMIRYAQKLAVAQQRPVYVQFNSERVALCFDSACSSKVTYPSGTGTSSSACDGGSTWFCAAVPSGLSYTAKVSSTSTSSIYFDSLGKPWSGAQALSSSLTVTIIGDTTNRLFYVESETGYVRQ
jgi:MSHA pilin protein MshC